MVKKAMRELECLCELGVGFHELIPMALELMGRSMPGYQFDFKWKNAVNEPNAIDPMVVCLSVPESPMIGLQKGAATSDSIRGTLLISRINGLRPSPVSHDAVFRAMAQCLGDGLGRGARLNPFNSEVADRLGEGRLLMDATGQLLHGCGLGQRLLQEATGTHGPDAKPPHPMRGFLMNLLEQALCSPIAIDRQWGNERGQFGFRAQVLSTGTGAQTGKVLVLVRRRGSMAARLWLDSARFPLSARERQLAVLMGLGMGYGDAASHLALTRNTVVSYIRRTYEKLGISSREQLLQLFLATEASASLN